MLGRGDLQAVLPSTKNWRSGRWLRGAVSLGTSGTWGLTERPCLRYGGKVIDDPRTTQGLHIYTHTRTHVPPHVHTTQTRRKMEKNKGIKRSRVYQAQCTGPARVIHAMWLHPPFPRPSTPHSLPACPQSPSCSISFLPLTFCTLAMHLF